MTEWTATLNRIAEYSPCYSGWRKLLAYLGKTASDDEPLAITTILDSNGLKDALWVLRVMEGHDREIRLLACDYAERALQRWEALYPEDRRPHEAIAVSRRYADGLAAMGELAVAMAAAASACATCPAEDVASVAAWVTCAACVPSALGAAADHAVFDAAEREWQAALLRRYCSGEFDGGGEDHA